MLDLGEGHVDHRVGAKLAGFAEKGSNPFTCVQVTPGGPLTAQYLTPAIDLGWLAGRARWHM
jgi:hypothetical protein